jgi:hypothetical protein
VGEEKIYINQSSTGDLPPGAPSASTAWLAMRQLLDKEMPTRVKSKKHRLLLLILFPLLTSWPLLNRDSGKQLISLPVRHGPVVATEPGLSPLSRSEFGVTAVASYPTNNKQPRFEEKIISAQTGSDLDMSLNQSQVQQMLSKPQNSDHLVKSPDQKSHADKNETTAEEATKLEFQFGLSWTLPVPFAGGQNYFAGPNGAAQPYRYVLPGAWMSLRADTYQFIVCVNPFASSMVRPAVLDSSVSEPDSVTRVLKSNTISKLFGFVASLHVDHEIGGHWWAGGGLQGNWWQGAVGTVHEETQKRPSPATGPGSLSYQSKAEAVPDSAWANLSRFQIFLNAELIYRTSRWQAGIEAGFSVTPLANSGNPKNLLNAAFFFRLPLVTKQLKMN